jgi:predicted ABC-type ATPase
VNAFVNADVIARGLSALSPERVAVSAGKIMLRRLDELEQSGFETVLYFICLRSAELAVARVVQRVASGGHSIPEQDVRRRFNRGLANLHRVYRPLVSRWVVYDNSDAMGLRLVASGTRSQIDVVDRRIWAILTQESGLQA